MALPPLSLFAPAPHAPWRFDGEPGDRPPLPLDALRTALQAAQGAQWVEIDGPEPSAHPDLLDVVGLIGEAGARCRLTTNGWRFAAPGVLERLRDAGLAQVTFVLWGGTAETHDRLVGRPGAFDELFEAVDVAGRLNRVLVTVRFVLLAENHAECAAATERARLHVDRYELVRLNALLSGSPTDRALLARHGVRRRDAMAAVQAAWETARINHVKMTTRGFASWPAIPMPLPPQAPLQPADGTLLELLRASVPVPSVMGGTWATPADGDVTGLWWAVENARSLHDLGLQLAACGCPPLDLPPAMGGRGLDHPPGTPAPEVTPMRVDGVPILLERSFDAVDNRPLPAWQPLAPGARVAVVAGPLSDNILALSTLPTLVERLRQRGVDATLLTAWDAPFNPYDNLVRLPHELTLHPDASGDLRVPEDLVEAFANTPARIAHTLRQGPAWLAGLDLSTYDVIVVPGFENGRAVLTNPTRRVEARIIVPDLHLMSGASSWHQHFVRPGERVADGSWWPGEQVEIHSLFPRNVRAYHRAGVPMRQIHWHPYPVHPGHFPPGRPAHTAPTLFAGGAHQRDWRTLAAAWRQVPPGTRPLRLHTPDPVPAPLVNQGEVRLLHFHEALANARFVIIPLVPDERRPAGPSVVSMALAAGRPVIATATHSMIDNLRHGHNAILVPPEDPAALAAAITRLDQDDELLERLAAGARRGGVSVSVDTWARMLVEGAPPVTSWSMEPDGRGPWYSWEV